MGFLQVAQDYLDSHQYLKVITNTKHNLSVISDNTNFANIPAEDR